MPALTPVTAGRSPRICLSLGAASVAELQRRLGVHHDADLVEIRLDHLDHPEGLGAADLARLIACARLPAVITCRPSWEGGGYAGQERERHALLARGLAAGARYVDVELDAEWVAEAVAEWPGKVIVSHHWERATADDLPLRVSRMTQLSPAIAKLVKPAASVGDGTSLLEAAAHLREGGIETACFCMGAAGRASRLLAIAHLLQPRGRRRHRAGAMATRSASP